MNHELEVMNPELLSNLFLEIIKSGNYAVIITLTNGDLLFGDLNFGEQFFDNKPDERMWFVKWKSEGSGYRSVHRIPSGLIFNTDDGEVNGKSNIVYFKHDEVADIRPLNWEGECFKRLIRVPNPYAKIIYNNNLEIAKKHNFLTRLYTYGMFSSSTSVIIRPPEEINFKSDEIIYADLDYLKSSREITWTGSYGLGVNFKPSIYKKAHNKLKKGKIEKIANFVFPDNISEKWIYGFLVTLKNSYILDAEKHEDELVFCCEKEFFNPKENFVPIYIKKDSIGSGYNNLLGKIRSKLVFYCTTTQIPINIEGVNSTKNVLIARIIGYLKDQDVT